VKYRKQITATTQRAEKAEEKADEMALKIRQGSVVRVRDIKLFMLNANDKEVTRASRAARLRADMVLSANDIANPGARNIYLRITAPDGRVYNGRGSDNDIIVSSAKAYINAINRMIQSQRSRG
jgi:hypothetical protein